MESFEFSYDFSLLSAIDLQREKINFGEIISVFENSLTIGEPLPGYPLSELYYLMVGFSIKKRFLVIALRFGTDKITFLQTEVADENEIRTRYCGK